MSLTVPTSCWRDTGVVDGTRRWFRISLDGRRGWVSASQMPDQPTVPYCSDILPGETLYAGQYVYSPSGRFFLVAQGDGNLVLYGPGGPRWATMTGGPDLRFKLQPDSNMVVSRTVNGFTARNCTWYAAEQWRAHWPQHRYPDWNGDAHQWADRARQEGWQVYSQPMSQAVVVFPATTTSRYGHVAWVDALEQRADGIHIHITEMNRDGNGGLSTRWLRHSAAWQYIPAPEL